MSTGAENETGGGACPEARPERQDKNRNDEPKIPVDCLGKSVRQFDLQSLKLESYRLSLWRVPRQDNKNQLCVDIEAIQTTATSHWTKLALHG